MEACEVGGSLEVGWKPRSLVKGWKLGWKRLGDPHGFGGNINFSRRPGPRCAAKLNLRSPRN